MPNRRKQRKMAVKKHELVHDNRLQPDLAALEQYLQLMNEQHTYLPPPIELVKTCQDIVKCLSRATGNEEDLWLLLQAVEEFLIRVMNTVSCELRQEVVTAVLDKFFSLISDPQSDACPATSTVLVVIDGTDNNSSISAARWLVQERDNGPGGAGLRSSLSCLYRWMYEWHGTPSLGEWIMSYIKALEENERFDILIEVSVDNLGSMFSALDAPALRHSHADVIFHVLASLRENTDALDRILAHVGRVLTQLAAESGQWSRTLLQNIVDILTAMIDCLMAPLKGDAKEAFRVKYADVIGCLERHMASRGCRFLQLPPWRPRNVACVRAPSLPRVPTRKVGLINLGNTCYMNSVMQALLVTRQFSTHVVLRMNGVPYWSKVGILFTKMLHSISTKLNTEDFFAVVKPPFFTTDTQHDSSEFLGYLFELLSSYEHSSDRHHDYSRPAVLNTANRWRTNQLLLTNGDNNRPGTSQNRRSVSPRPGSSAAGSSSSMKRISPEHEIAVPPKKRLRHLGIPEAIFPRRDSFIDNLFGGVLLTRVECTHCHSSSLSRDVFRDLQLAFPEKPNGWKYTVQTLLDYYCSKESLTGDNKYQCADCGVLRDAERSVLIETTPKYLILVLKHFKFDSKMQVQTKLIHPMYHNSTVNLPTVRSQADHAAYTLYAAIIHSGTTLDSGHYYTLAKDSDQWYLYNDDLVTLSDESELSEDGDGATPYILFYRRDDIEEPSAPALEDIPQTLQEMVLAHNKYYVETVRQMHISRP